MGNALVNRLAFTPTPPIPITEDDEPYMLTYDEGRHRLFYRTVGDPIKSQIAILYSYGNMANSTFNFYWVSRIRRILQSLLKQEVVVYVYDYPGYGKSHGQCNEELFHDCVWRMWEHVCTQKTWTGLFLWGKSLGTAATTYIANRCVREEFPIKPTGVVLESTLGQGIWFAMDHFMPFSFYAENPVYDPLNQVKLAKQTPNWGPTLFIHGDADHVIDKKHAKKVMEQLTSPSKLFLVMERGHNDIYYHMKSPETICLIEWMLQVLEENSNEVDEFKQARLTYAAEQLD